MHTDAIISNDLKSAKKFLNRVKSSIAMHNTSTQFFRWWRIWFGGEVEFPQINYLQEGL